MATYYAKRALEILQKEGLTELIDESKNFVKRQLSIDKKRFEYNTIKNKHLNQIKYDSPAEPYSKIHINSNDIEYENSVFSVTSTGLGKVRSGDWDTTDNLCPIEENKKKQGIIQRFKHGKDWENTSYYTVVGNKTRYNKESRLKQKLEHVDNLYNSIKEDGYRPADDNRNDREGTGYGQYLEVLVNIDRSGEIYHAGKGNHRLAIAKVLDINIPVQVLVRHEKWQELRDEIHNNGLPEEHEDLRDHPDLQDVLN